jgi:hypothetical protein
MLPAEPERRGVLRQQPATLEQSQYAALGLLLYLGQARSVRNAG